MFIIVDAGMAVTIFFLVVLFGITGVEALGVWISENFIWIIIGLIIISIIKSIIFLKETSCGPVASVVCAICDAVRLIPVGYFLWVLFNGFAELAHAGALEMLFGVILNFLGAAIFLLPGGAVFYLAESLCSSAIEDDGDCIMYIIWTVLGIGAQMLLFFIFGVL